MLNNAQVKALFDREAVLLGTSDGIPETRAIELFGADAVEFARGLPGLNSNGFGNGRYTMSYLTFHGLQMAATYANIEEFEGRVAR